MDYLNWENASKAMCVTLTYLTYLGKHIILKMQAVSKNQNSERMYQHSLR